MGFFGDFDLHVYVFGLQDCSLILYLDLFAEVEFRLDSREKSTLSPGRRRDIHAHNHMRHACCS